MQSHSKIRVQCLAVNGNPNNPLASFRIWFSTAFFTWSCKRWILVLWQVEECLRCSFGCTLVQNCFCPGASSIDQGSPSFTQYSVIQRSNRSCTLPLDSYVWILFQGDLTIGLTPDIIWLPPWVGSSTRVFLVEYLPIYPRHYSNSVWHSIFQIPCWP